MSMIRVRHLLNRVLYPAVIFGCLIPSTQASASETTTISLEDAVEEIFRPIDRYRWQLRLMFLPDADAESQITIGCLANGTYLVETATTDSGVFKLLQSGRSVASGVTRDALDRITVKRIARPLDALRARSWLKEVFEAVANTPNKMYAAGLVASSSSTEMVILHPTKYIGMFDEYGLKFRLVALGPKATNAASSEVSLVQVMARIRDEVIKIMSASNPDR